MELFCKKGLQDALGIGSSGSAMDRLEIEGMEGEAIFGTKQPALGFRDLGFPHRDRPCPPLLRSLPVPKRDAQSKRLLREGGLWSLQSGLDRSQAYRRDKK